MDNQIQQNIKAGITVSLVSIPLSISLAIASGATPLMGVVTAIWAGLFAAIFGGSFFNIVGPTGALSALLLTFALNYGAAYLPFLALVTGVLVLIAFFLKAEKYLKFFPALAIQGFTLGVAFMIAFNQATSALGILHIEKHEHFIDNLMALVHAIPETSLVNFGVFVIVLIGLFVVLKFVPKVPAAIVFSVVGILVGVLSKNHVIPLDIYTLSDKFSDLTFSLILPMKPLLQFDVLNTSVTIAVVAILETMISAKIADGMTGTKHNPRKEMFGLALANIASGLSGGIPATAALARTSLNIKSGATNRVSSITNGIAVLGISYFLFSYFKFLPLPVIAAILVFTAIRMVEVHHLKKLYNFSKKEFYATLLVALVCIIEDAIVGLLVGAVIGLITLVYRQSRGSHQITVNGKPGKMPHSVKVHKSVDDAVSEKLEKGGVAVYAIHGALLYINGQEHLAALGKLAEHYKTIVIKMGSVHLIDLDGIEVFSEIIALLNEKKVNTYVVRVHADVFEKLAKSKEFRQLQEEGKVVEKTADALRKLGYQVEG